MYCPRQNVPVAYSEPIPIRKLSANCQYSLNSKSFGPLSSSPPDEWSKRLSSRLENY